VLVEVAKVFGLLGGVCPILIKVIFYLFIINCSPGSMFVVLV